MNTNSTPKPHPSQRFWNEVRFLFPKTFWLTIALIFCMLCVCLGYMAYQKMQEVSRAKTTKHFGRLIDSDSTDLNDRKTVIETLLSAQKVCSRLEQHLRELDLLDEDIQKATDQYLNWRMVDEEYERALLNWKECTDQARDLGYKKVAEELGYYNSTLSRERPRIRF